MGGGGGRWGGKAESAAPISTFENFLDQIFKEYLPNVATFIKIYWRTRFWKKFASRLSRVAMVTPCSTPCLLKFGRF